ncbi:transposase [Neobacillus sp. LXY-1]|uniref:transposase n=1 Tax=Neobacillus sp. LXY-1 TaxID=3379133 RepID=UPI003EDED93D
MSKSICDKQLKKRIVKMMMEQNKSVAQVARETGININTLYSWKKKYALEFIHETLPQMTEFQRLKFFQKHIRALQKENMILRTKKG